MKTNNSRTALSLLIGFIALAGCGASSDTGTMNSPTSCGPGTHLSNNVCVADANDAGADVVDASDDVVQDADATNESVVDVFVEPDTLEAPVDSPVDSLSDVGDEQDATADAGSDVFDAGVVDVASDASAEDGVTADVDAALDGNVDDVQDATTIDVVDEDVSDDGSIDGGDASIDAYVDVSNDMSEAAVDVATDAVDDVTDASPDVPSGPCQSAADCDDGFSCTIDSCCNGTCSHVAGPNSGTTSCGSSAFCIVGKGCVPATVPCVNTCADDGNPCTIEYCDHATSTCRYTMLDNDSDGYSPAVCGGNDCNDADPQINVCAVEVCNGIDDNCNGLTDENVVCTDPLTSCQFNAPSNPGVTTCACNSANWCCHKMLGSQSVSCNDPNATALPPIMYCANTLTDNMNCGNCGTRCPVLTRCYNGTCH